MYDHELPPCAPAAFRIGRSPGAVAMSASATAEVEQVDVIEVPLAGSPVAAFCAGSMGAAFALVHLHNGGCSAAVATAVSSLIWLLITVGCAFAEADAELALLPDGDLHITFRSFLRERCETIPRSALCAVALVERSGDDGPIWETRILFHNRRDPIDVWGQPDCASALAKFLRVPLERHPDGAAPYVLGGASATLSTDA